MRAIPQLVSAPLNPTPIAEHFRRSHPPCEHRSSFNPESNSGGVCTQAIHRRLSPRFFLGEGASVLAGQTLLYSQPQSSAAKPHLFSRSLGNSK